MYTFIKKHDDAARNDWRESHAKKGDPLDARGVRGGNLGVELIGYSGKKAVRQCILSDIVVRVSYFFNTSVIVLWPMTISPSLFNNCKCQMKMQELIPVFQVVVRDLANAFQPVYHRTALYVQCL